MAQIERQQTVLHILQNLRDLGGLKKLFWEELNYERENKPLSMRGWPDSVRKVLIDDPILFASGGADNAFHVVYCRLASDSLQRGLERPIVNQLIREHPYCLLVFSDSSQSAWHFLNEARLTALALAIYLGAARLVLRSLSAGADGTIIVRLLVLDDVLIGLDLANRLPVLRVLSEEFSDWQVLLFTFDHTWFEMAKEYTENTGLWTYLTLREMPTVQGLPCRPNIEPCPGSLAVAEKHFRSGDLMAAAVYIRAAFETRIKNVCEANGIKVKYKHDSKSVKADELWQGIVDRQKERQEKNQADFIPSGLVNDVETLRSTILNSLSHSGTTNLVRDEVQFALDAVKKLQEHHFKKL